MSSVPSDASTADPKDSLLTDGAFLVEAPLHAEAPLPWPRALRRGILSVDELARRGLVEESELPRLREALQHLDLRVPAAFQPGIEAGDPALALQALPSREELSFFPEELDDPIGDDPCSPTPLLTHRYPTRVLLKPTYLCAMYCRFCFRRNKVSHSEHQALEADLEAAFAYIRAHPEVREVILTGGDPLVLTDARLREVLAPLQALPQLKVIRLHTRIPTALPQRVTPELIRLLRSTGKAVWVIAHVNAASELTPEAIQAFGSFVDGGVPVLSQSVLLKGVNDSRESLAALFEALVDLRVKPYYLHYPDLAKGTRHFRIPLARAMELVRSLRGALSGLCVPPLVVDLPGGRGKVLVEAQSSRQISENSWEFISPLNGERIRVDYPPCEG